MWIQVEHNVIQDTTPSYQPIIPLIDLSTPRMIAYKDLVFSNRNKFNETYHLFPKVMQTYTMLQMNRLVVRLSHLSSLQMVVIVLSVFISYQMIIHPLLKKVCHLYEKRQNEEITRYANTHIGTFNLHEQGAIQKCQCFPLTRPRLIKGEGACKTLIIS